MDNLNKISDKITYSALIVLSLGIFTSVSFSALSHILLIFSGSYSFFRWLKVRDLPVKKSWWALLVVMVSCWLSVLMNWEDINEPLKHIFKTKYFLIALLSYFAFAYFKRDFLTHKKTSLLIKLFLLSATIATISGLIGLYSGFNPLKMKNACHETRACGLYGMYMTYGYGISLFMVLLTGMIIYKKTFSKWINEKWVYLAFAINVCGLLLSYARGAWLGYLIAIPFFFFKDHKKKFLIVTLIALITLGLGFLSPKVRDTFLNRGESNHQRIALYQAALKVMEEKPVFGYGYRNFEPNSTFIKKRHNLDHPGHGGHAHNNILEHLASTGLLGGLAVILFFGFWLGEAYQKSWLFSFVISFLVSGMVQYTFGDGENLFLILSIFSFF